MQEWENEMCPGGGGEVVQGGMKLSRANLLKTRSVQVTRRQARSWLPILHPPSHRQRSVRGALSLHTRWLVFVPSSPRNFALYLFLSAAPPSH